MHRSHKKKRSGGGRKHHHCQDSFDSACSEDNRESSPPLKKNLNYEILKSDVMGRYLVAARDLKPGSIIISEQPVVVGPCSGCKVLCLGCYHRFDRTEVKDAYKCKGCGWPMCGPKCTGLNKRYGHNIGECAALRQANTSKILDFDNIDNLRLEYNAIVPLRCLLLKTLDPENWNILMTMESHNGLRKNIKEVWNTNQIQVVDRIRLRWGMQHFTEEEIHTVCGILEVNAFEVGQQEIAIRGIYPTAFLIAHDCVPNTNHTDEERTYRLIVRSSTEIKKGDQISVSYAYTLQSTLKRREHLLESKYFLCQCRRCADPTELGTYAGALKCPKCQVGLLLSTNPLDANAFWKCNNKMSIDGVKCPGYTVAAPAMRILMDKIGDEVEVIDGNDVESFEQFLKRYRNVLHPNHYHCLGVKHSLSQLYGKIIGYMIYELTEAQLIRKREVCREILKVFDVLEPGYSRLRGVTLYEYHAPIMILTTRDFESRAISKNELKNRLKEVTKYLEEASIILGFETEISPEGLMASAAKDALVKIREWRKIIGRS